MLATEDASARPSLRLRGNTRKRFAALRAALDSADAVKVAEAMEEQECGLVRSKALAAEQQRWAALPASLKRGHRRRGPAGESSMYRPGTISAIAGNDAVEKGRTAFVQNNASGVVGLSPEWHHNLHTFLSKQGGGMTLLHLICSNAEDVSFDVIPDEHAETRRRVLRWALTQRPLEIDQRDLQGRTPLHLACLNGRYEEALTLVSAGADVNALSGSTLSYQDRLTPIDMALLAGDMGIVEMLDMNRASPIADKALDKNDRRIGKGAGIREDVFARCCANPFHLHAKSAVEFLFRKGYTRVFSINQLDRRGRVPLFYATRARNVPVMELLIGRGAKITAMDPVGQSLLHAVVGDDPFDNDDPCEALLCLLSQPKAKSLLTAITAVRRDTVMHWAARRRRHAAELIAMLVRAGGEVSALNWSDKSPLHMASSVFNVDGLATLLDAGADPNAVSKAGDTPMTMWVKALSGATPDMTVEVVSGDQNVDDGVAAIHVPEIDVYDAVDLLIRWGGTLSFVDQNGNRRSAVADAVKHCPSDATLKLLLAQDATEVLTAVPPEESLVELASRWRRSKAFTRFIRVTVVTAQAFVHDRDMIPAMVRTVTGGGTPPTASLTGAGSSVGDEDLRPLKGEDPTAPWLSSDDTGGQAPVPLRSVPSAAVAALYLTVPRHHDTGLLEDDIHFTTDSDEPTPRLEEFVEFGENEAGTPRRRRRRRRPPQRTDGLHADAPFVDAATPPPRRPAADYTLNTFLSPITMTSTAVKSTTPTTTRPTSAAHSRRRGPQRSSRRRRRQRHTRPLSASTGRRSTSRSAPTPTRRRRPAAAPKLQIKAALTHSTRPQPSTASRPRRPEPALAPAGACTGARTPIPAAARSRATPDKRGAGLPGRPVRVAHRDREAHVAGADDATDDIRGAATSSIRQSVSTRKVQQVVEAAERLRIPIGTDIPSRSRSLARHGHDPYSLGPPRGSWPYVVQKAWDADLLAQAREEELGRTRELRDQALSVLASVARVKSTPADRTPIMSPVSALSAAQLRQMRRSPLRTKAMPPSKPVRAKLCYGYGVGVGDSLDAPPPAPK